jgi:hypothetical protein
LSYTDWRDTSLVDFKRYNGFQEMRVPRYFVPLTAKGRIALSLRLHRGWKAMLPAQVVAPLKKLRRSWNDYTQKSEPGA